MVNLTLKEAQEVIMDNKDKEIVFVEGETLRLNGGDVIKIPRLTIGKILSISSAISKLAKAAKEEAPELFSAKEWAENPEAFGPKLVGALPILFPVLSEQIVDVVASYIGREPDWVKENIDLEDLGEIATPLFASLLSQGNLLMGKINQAFEEKAAQK